MTVDEFLNHKGGAILTSDDADAIREAMASMEYERNLSRQDIEDLKRQIEAERLDRPGWFTSSRIRQPPFY